MAGGVTTINSGSSLVINGDDIPFGAYQAIYHKLTKRVETEHNIYDHAYDIFLHDIINIHERLSQLLKQYQVKALRCEVTHSLKDDSTRQHSSFDKFKVSDCSIRSCTTSLNYELDFLIVLPPEIASASEIAQRYKLSIRVDQDFVESSDFDVPLFMRNMVTGNNAVLNVEYADYAVYKALRATVDGWIASLPVRKPSKLVDTLKKYERSLNNNIPNVARLGAYSGSAWYIFSHQTLSTASAIAAGVLASE